MQLDCITHLDQCLFRDLDNPEKTRIVDARIEIMNLRSRTGIEKVNSYFHEGAAGMHSVLRDVLALIYADICP